MFSAVLLLNVSKSFYWNASHDLTRLPNFFDQLILTDGVVVWRAWVICSDHNKAILLTPAVILAIDSRTPALLPFFNCSVSNFFQSFT